MDHELERFEARADDGTVRTIIAWQTFARTGGLSGSHILKGQHRFSLLNGKGVAQLEGDGFQVIENGEVLHRISVCSEEAARTESMREVSAGYDAT